MEKEKIQIEYAFNRVSKSSLWTAISSADGLSGWFADAVPSNGQFFTFQWQGHALEAELISTNPLVSIRFHWLEEEPDTYFEFRLHKEELTGDIMLEIVDFADAGEQEELTSLWNTQVKTLRRKLGI